VPNTLSTTLIKHPKLAQPFEESIRTQACHVFSQILNLNTEFIHAYPYYAYGILRRAFDSGLIQNRQLMCLDGKIHHAPGILILKRSSILHLVSKRIFSKDGQYNNTPVTFLLLDIKNLRSADFPDSLGNKAADYILNNVALRLQTLLSTSSLFSQYNPLLGRYGGDEFLIVIFESLTNEQLEQINTEIVTEIGKDVGFYRTVNGGVEVKPVSIKHNKCDVITPPLDTIQQLVFFYYLKRQLMLNSQDIIQILDDLEQQMGKNIKLNPLAQSLYFTECHTVEHKITYLGSNKKDLATIITLAKHIDDSNTNLHAQELLVNFVDEVVFDSLLGEEIRGFGDIGIEMQNGSFGELYGFDVKFIKEFNDEFSIVRGDILIKCFFNGIRDCFTQKEREEMVYFARRGGTMIVGIKKNKILSAESQLRLQKLLETQTIPLYFKQDIIQIPIGVTSYKYDLDEHPTYQQIINQIVSQAEYSWYQRISNMMCDSKDILQSFSAQYQIQSSELQDFRLDLSDKQSIDITDLFFVYFLSNKSFHLFENHQLPLRYYDRMKMLVESIQTCNLKTEIKQEWVVLLQNCISKI
jgi:GGDEF domain-containing protein